MAYRQKVDYQHTLMVLRRFSGNRRKAAEHMGVRIETVRAHVKVLESMNIEVPAGGKNYNKRGQCKPYLPSQETIAAECARLKAIHMQSRRAER